MLSLQLHPPAAAAPTDDCVVTSLPGASARVLWASLIPPSNAQEMGQQVALQGAVQDGRFLVSEVIGAEPAPAATPTARGMPPPARTRAAPGWTAFGAEERAWQAADGQLRCRPGRAPAGFVWKPRNGWLATLPQTLALQASGAGEWTVAMADTARLARENPLPLGSIQLGPESSSHQLALPPQATSWRALVLSCPATEARLALSAVELRVARAERAAWVWSPAVWLERPEVVWALQRELQLTRVYITVPVQGDAVRDVDALTAFLAQAHARGLAVWAVMGDPAHAMPQHRAAMASLIRAYRRYNDGAAPSSRLAGLQLDIEPYLLPGYRLDPPAWRNAYLDSVRTARTAWGPGALDLAVPVWWGTHPAWGEPWLAALLPLEVSLTVMNYRTDAGALTAGARPFLQWADAHGSLVSMALEAGPLPDERRQHYVANAGGGELWLLRLGQHRALVLFDQAQRGLPGRAFSYTYTSEQAATRITFSGDAQAMRSMVDLLDPQWRTSPRFAGFAMHGLDEGR